MPRRHNNLVKVRPRPRVSSDPPKKLPADLKRLWRDTARVHAIRREPLLGWVAMDLCYRAEAKRRHSGRVTSWKGKWRPDPNRAIAQATRWRDKEPSAEVYVACSNGMKATLDEMEAAQASGKRRC